MLNSSCFSIFQAILATAFAKKDYDKAEMAASRVLQVLCHNLYVFFFFFFTSHVGDASCHMSEDHICLTNMIVLLRVCDALLLQLGLVLGLILAVILGVGMRFGARLFTDDVNVLHLISIGIPVLLMSETSNSTFELFDPK